MERQLDQILRQLDQSTLQIAQLSTLLRQQSDTANRRHDVLYRVVDEGVRGLGRRLDQHEAVFEEIDDRLDARARRTLVI